MQLTRGEANTWPDLTPDGQWVVYTSFISGKPTLQKVSINGGEPVKVSHLNLRLAGIPPDGKRIAAVLFDEKATPPWRIEVIPFSGGQSIASFPLPSTTYFWIRWTSDGRAVSYIDDYGGVSNIWSQPLDGGPLKQLTHFESDRMFNFQWLPDGTLLCARGIVTSDVVLISDFK